MIGTCFPGDETQTKSQWERKPVGFGCALASYWNLLSQDKSLDDFFWITGLEDFFDFIGLINNTCVCPFNLRVYSWHAHKDSPTRKWCCRLWSLLATDDTCSSSSTNLGKRVSPLRPVIPARPFCKGVAASMKHCLLSTYLNNKTPYKITSPLITLPRKSWAKISGKPSGVETLFPRSGIKRESIKKNQAAHISAPSGVHTEVRCIFISAAKLMWGMPET